MKQPTSKGGGTTGAWKSFKDAYNRVGDKKAEERRKRLEQINKNKKKFGKK